MLLYFSRRLLYTIPILFGVALVVFILFHCVGGDPAYQMLGNHVTPEQIDALRAELGLNQPMYIQFLEYLKQIITFDFGQSYSTKQKISEMLAQGIPASLSLAIPAFLIETVLALSIALLVSFFRGSLFDKAVVVLCIMGMSISSLAYILFGQYILAYKITALTGWVLFPVSGYDNDLFFRFHYLALPICIWIVLGLGINVRVFRTFVLEEINQDYVRTAQAKGLSDKIVLFKHVLKNALIPVLTHLVIQIPFLMMGSFLLESFFGIPGIGGMTIDAIHNSDFPVLKAMTTIGALLFILGNLTTDFLYSVVDPRVKLGEVKQ